jgi:hypothetical protein
MNKKSRIDDPAFSMLIVARRARPLSLLVEQWIASLALAMTAEHERLQKTCHSPARSEANPETRIVERPKCTSPSEVRASNRRARGGATRSEA